MSSTNIHIAVPAEAVAAAEKLGVSPETLVAFAIAETVSSINEDAAYAAAVKAALAIKKNERT